MCGVWAGPGVMLQLPEPPAASPALEKLPESAQWVGHVPQEPHRPSWDPGEIAGRQVGNKACIALRFLCSVNCFNDLYVNVTLKNSALLLCIYLLYELFL